MLRPSEFELSKLGRLGSERCQQLPSYPILFCYSPGPVEVVEHVNTTADLHQDNERPKRTQSKSPTHPVELVKVTRSALEGKSISRGLVQRKKRVMSYSSLSDTITSHVYLNISHCPSTPSLANTCHTPHTLQALPHTTSSVLKWAGPISNVQEGSSGKVTQYK